MPTGTGKTVLLVFLVEMVVRSGRRCLVLVPSKELIDQVFSQLASVGIIPGVMKQEHDDWDAQVVLAQVQTISRMNRLRAIPKDRFDLLIIVECHLANAKSYLHVEWVLWEESSPPSGRRAWRLRMP